MSTENKEKEVNEAIAEFGSESFKQLLLASSESEEALQEMLKELEKIVYNYALLRLKIGFCDSETKTGKGISTKLLRDELSAGNPELGIREYHEFIGEAILKIRNGIHKFILNLDNYPEPNQRRAWLKTAVYNILATYLKKRMNKLKPILENEESLWYEYDDGTKKVMVEKAASTDFLPEKQAEVNSEKSEFAELIVRQACSLRSQPHNILAYLFNRIIIYELSGHKYNCDANATCKALNGHSLFQLKNVFISQFYKVYGIMLSEDVLCNLERKVGKDEPTEVGKLVFRFTDDKENLKPGEIIVNVKSLTNITNQITKSITEKLKTEESLSDLIKASGVIKAGKGCEDDDSDA